jgi:cytoskeletal protein RodZ
MTTIGKALVSERKEKNITLEEISKKTNISIKSLECLENDEFENIPGKFYIKNYIKSYLNAIDGDEKAFWEKFQNSIDTVVSGIPEKSTPYYSKLRYSRFKKKSLLFSLLALIIVITMALSLLFVSKGNIFKDIGEFIGQTKKSPATTSTDLLKFTAHAVPGKPEVSLDAPAVKVDAQFNQKCWVQVYRGNQKIIEQVFQKNDHAQWKGYDLRVTLGNPSAVKLLVNGQEVTYLNNMARSERLVLTPATIKGIIEK